MNVYSFAINLNDKISFFNNNQQYLIKNNNIYIEGLFEILDTKISIYKSNKVVVQGKNATKIMQLYFSNYFTKNNETTQNKQIKTNLDKYDFLIGSDEVGVGDYFGGLVVCAVSLRPNQTDILSQLGVDDSKKINDEKIKVLAPKLMEIVDYKIAQINPEQYNFLIYKYNNSHVLKTLLHNRALSLLLANKNRNNCYVILDEFASTKNYYQYLKTLNEQSVVTIDLFETKAESKYLCVACASIIARYYFLKQIDELSESVNLKLPLGAWNSNIQQTATQLKNKIGFDNLKHYVKLHFKNTKKI